MKQLIRLLLIVTPSVAFSQAIPSPNILAGDSWTYRDVVEKGPTGWLEEHDQVTVNRVTASALYVTSRHLGSAQPPRESIQGVDWSRVRSIDGTETTINRPMAFPLTVGKSWEVEYVESHPNKLYKYQRWNHRFRVIGFEAVEVAAGKFSALKIEEEGHWVAELEPRETVKQEAQTAQGNTTMMSSVDKTPGQLVTGRTYKAIWYAPEVKRWVKSVEEYYDPDGTRSERFTSELESFKVGP